MCARIVLDLKERKTVDLKELVEIQIDSFKYHEEAFIKWNGPSTTFEFTT